jgi:hypothetical protein
MRQALSQSERTALVSQLLESLQDPTRTHAHVHAAEQQRQQSQQEQQLQQQQQQQQELQLHLQEMLRRAAMQQLQGSGSPCSAAQHAFMGDVAPRVQPDPDMTAARMLAGAGSYSGLQGHGSSQSNVFSSQSGLQTAIHAQSPGSVRPPQPLPPPPAWLQEALSAAQQLQAHGATSVQQQLGQQQHQDLTMASAEQQQHAQQPQAEPRMAQAQQSADLTQALTALLAQIAEQRTPRAE